MPFFRQQILKPATADTRRIEVLIKDLDSKRFPVRQNARQGLRELGRVAQPALQQALNEKPTLEVRRQLEELLQRIRSLQCTPEELQSVRVIEVLEHIATPDAKRLLTTLAAGAPGAVLTEEARTALARLK
jgi:hypothetical protein